MTADEERSEELMNENVGEEPGWRRQAPLDIQYMLHTSIQAWIKKLVIPKKKKKKNIPLDIHIYLKN